MALYTPYGKNPATPHPQIQTAVRTEHDADGTIHAHIRHMHGQISVTTTVDVLIAPAPAQFAMDGQPPHNATAQPRHSPHPR